MEPLLLQYTVRKRRITATTGIQCPDDICENARRNSLDVVQTLTDGRCGIDAVRRCILDVATRSQRIRNTEAYKQLYKLRGSTEAMLGHMRKKIS